MRVRILLAAVLLIATAACSSSTSKTAAKTTTTVDKTKPVHTDALFVVSGTGGTAAAPANGTFALSISGIHRDAVFFTDRPVHDSGIVGVDKMLSMLAKGHQGPPNGALEVQTGEQGPVVAALELTDPHWDAATGTLQTQARVLPKTTGPHLHYYDSRLASQLPPTFGSAALFIDNAVDTVQLPSGPATTTPPPTSTATTLKPPVTAPPGSVPPVQPAPAPGTSPFGSTNFCAQQVQATTGPVTLTGQFKWNTDTWDPAPPANGTQILTGAPNNPNWAYWRSDGGFARGCGNTSTWQTWDGVTFHTSITDPYTGSNNIYCTSSDTIFHPCHLGSQSTTTGDNITVYFYFCDLRNDPSACPGL